MRLLGVGPDAHRFGVGFGGLLQASALLLGDAQVEPALEMIRRELHQLGAIARRGFIVVGVERAGRQAFQRGLRERTHGQQPLGILLDRGVILARHADGDQVHQAFFRLRILFENLQIQGRGFVELPQQLQRNGLAEQRRFVIRLARQHLVEAGDGRLRLLLMQQADAQAQLRFLALRIDLESLG